MQSIPTIAIGSLRRDSDRFILDTGDGWLEVRGGLQEGEDVVVSSQFLIDSASKLREAHGKLLAGARSESAEPLASKPTDSEENRSASSMDEE